MSKTEKKSGKKTVTSIISGVLIALLVTVVLLFACAAAISNGLLKLDHSRQLTIAACAIGGFFGSLITVRQLGRQKSLLMGIGEGLLFFLVLMILGLLLYEESAPGLHQLPVLSACLCTGGLAGLMSRRKKKRRI